MASRQNITGRPGASGVLKRAMNPRAPKITPPAELAGGSGPVTRPRPKGLAGLVAQGVDAASTAEPVNPPRPQNLAGRVSTAVETAREGGQPRAGGLGGMVSRAAQQAKEAQDVAVTQAQNVVDPNLGGTTTEKPTRNLPRRSVASRSGRIRSELE